MKTWGTAKTAPTKTPSMLDIAWAAGIYEGEGSVDKRGRVTVAQKDPEILYRLCSYFGGSVSTMPNNGKADGIFRWSLYGARARGFLFTVFSFMSGRRRQQILPALIGAN